MKTPTPAPLLLVGFQAGVRRALRALDRPAFALIPEGQKVPDAPELSGVLPIELHGAAKPIESTARALLAGVRPAAVVALAERTVLVAARLREAFDLPGNDGVVALQCADKVEMKRAMERGGVPVARWSEVNRESRAADLIDALGLPLVFKPRRDSGGRGQLRANDEAEVIASLAELHTEGLGLDDYGWLAEGWIDAVEMSVEAFVNDGVVQFQNPTEYYVPRHANIVPASLPDKEWSELREFVERVAAAAGVQRGITHVELFRSAAGPVLGELAIRPPGGRLMTLLERAWGFDPWEAMLRLELGESYTFPQDPRQTAGVWVIHPGPGRLAAIHGLDEARSLPHVRRIALKVKPGAVVDKRVGTGQDIGSLYAEGPDRNTVAAALSTARDAIRFEFR